MLRSLKITLIGLLFAVSTTIANANSTATNIDRLMDAIGATASVDAFPQSLDLELNSEILTAQLGDPELARALSIAIKNSFTTERFDNAIKASITQRLSETEITDLLSWFETPLGLRVAALHQADQYAVAKRLHAGERPELTAKRGALIKTIDQLVMGSDNNVTIALEMGAVTGHAMMASMGMQVGLSQAREMITPQMQAELPNIIAEYRASIAIIYESLSDADLKNMISAMARPEVAMVNDAMWRGLHLAIKEGGAALGAELSAELNGAF